MHFQQRWIENSNLKSLEYIKNKNQIFFGICSWKFLGLSLYWESKAQPSLQPSWPRDVSWKQLPNRRTLIKPINFAWTCLRNFSNHLRLKHLSSGCNHDDETQKIPEQPFLLCYCLWWNISSPIKAYLLFSHLLSLATCYILAFHIQQIQSGDYCLFRVLLFGLSELLREISGSLAAKCSSWLLLLLKTL